MAWVVQAANAFVCRASVYEGLAVIGDSGRGNYALMDTEGNLFVIPIYSVFSYISKRASTGGIAAYIGEYLSTQFRRKHTTKQAISLPRITWLAHLVYKMVSQQLIHKYMLLLIFTP